MKGIADKVVMLHEHLDQAGISHAFGGAVALAYCVREPRATADIDVNVFFSPNDASDVFRALPSDVERTEERLARAIDQGQIRLRWGGTPLDLFFAYHEFHDAVARRTRSVTFRNAKIPVIDCGDLVVFKALFSRPQDWLDIQNIIESGGTDLDEPLTWVEELIGRDDPRFRRLATIGQPNEDEEFEVYRRVFGRPPREDDEPSP